MNRYRRAALLLCLTFAVTQGFCQMINETFFGIKFGSSSVYAKAKFDSLGVKYVENEKGTLYVKGVVFADYKYDFISMDFSEDKFNEIRFMVSLTPDISATERYQNIIDMLHSAYGEPVIKKNNTIGYIDRENICTYGHFFNDKDVCYDDMLKFKHFDVDHSPKDAITLQLTRIYSDVLDRLLSVPNPADSIGMEYMSSEYKTIRQKVAAVEISQPQRARALDYNHWIIINDWSSIKYTIDDISVTSDTVAIARVTIKNKGLAKTVSLSLVFESGNWFVDDFVINGYSEKRILEEYVGNANKIE